MLKRKTSYFLVLLVLTIPFLLTFLVKPVNAQQGSEIRISDYSPSIPGSSLYHSFLDTANNLLYVSTWGGGLTVINTQGTIPVDDD
ncbi:hypothetical protein ACFL0F_01760, partial [Patescibacteria group bacterium]